MNTIEQVGYEMGEELGRQNVVLDQLGDMAENTGSRIRRTMKEIDKFIDQPNNTVSWSIIGLLVIVVIVLFMSVIYLWKRKTSEIVEMKELIAGVPLGIDSVVQTMRMGFRVYVKSMRV